MKMNVSVIYNSAEDKILMCLRTKDPYKGKFNFIGGKVEVGETDLESAYREVEEETGITPEEIQLTYLMKFEYQMSKIELQVYVGKLQKEKMLKEEVNKLYWIDSNENFFDLDRYAGEGNMGHILEQIKLYHDQLF